MLNDAVQAPRTFARVVAYILDNRSRYSQHIPQLIEAVTSRLSEVPQNVWVEIANLAITTRAKSYPYFIQRILPNLALLSPEAMLVAIEHVISHRMHYQNHLDEVVKQTIPKLSKLPSSVLVFATDYITSNTYIFREQLLVFISEIAPRLSELPEKTRLHIIEKVVTYKEHETLQSLLPIFIRHSIPYLNEVSPSAFHSSIDYILSHQEDYKEQIPFLLDYAVQRRSDLTRKTLSQVIDYSIENLDSLAPLTLDKLIGVPFVSDLSITTISRLVRLVLRSGIQSTPNFLTQIEPRLSEIDSNVLIQVLAYDIQNNLTFDMQLLEKIIPYLSKAPFNSEFVILANYIASHLKEYPPNSVQEFIEQVESRSHNLPPAALLSISEYLLDSHQTTKASLFASSIVDRFPEKLPALPPRFFSLLAEHVIKNSSNFSNQMLAFIEKNITRLSQLSDPAYRSMVNYTLQQGKVYSHIFPSIAISVSERSLSDSDSANLTAMIISAFIETRPKPKEIGFIMTIKIEPREWLSQLDTQSLEYIRDSHVAPHKSKLEKAVISVINEKNPKSNNMVIIVISTVILAIAFYYIIFDELIRLLQLRFGTY
ncbi:hypothetical protein HY990_01975 [Candidatus Micrarchaeota archaeon]|nr:hypothetical protein [Candidatus Micrarchaeota archaeon]